MTPDIDPVDPDLRKMVGQAQNLGDPMNEVRRAVGEMLPDAVAIFVVTLHKTGPKTAAFAPGHNHSMMLTGEVTTLLQAFVGNTISNTYAQHLDKENPDTNSPPQPPQPKGGDL